MFHVVACYMSYTALRWYSDVHTIPVAGMVHVVTVATTTSTLMLLAVVQDTDSM